MSKNKISLVELCIFIIITMTWAYNITNFLNLQKVAIVVNTAMLFVIAYVTNKSSSDGVKNNKNDIINFLNKNKELYVFIVYVVTSLLMNIYNRLYGNVWEYMVLLLLVLIMYRQKKSILLFMYRPIVISFLLFVALSILFAPGSNMQYRAILINPNSSAIFILTVYIICSTNFMYSYNKYRVSSFLITCISSGYIFYIESRAAEICVIVSVIIYIIDSFRQKNKFQSICKSISLILLSIIIFWGIPFIHSNVSVYIYENIYEYNFSIYDLHNDRDRIIIDELKVDKNHIDSNSAKKNKNKIEENRLFKESGDYTTGRIDLWKIYGEKIELLGHSAPIEFNNQMRTAHNTYIHIAYINGLIAGISLLIFNIIIGIKALVKLIKRDDNEYMLVFISVLIYGTYTMIETLYSPLISSLTFLYYISINQLLNHQEVGKD